jgi:hypothetical protein
LSDAQSQGIAQFIHVIKALEIGGLGAEQANQARLYC